MTIWQLCVLAWSCDLVSGQDLITSLFHRDVTSSFPTKPWEGTELLSSIGVINVGPTQHWSKVNVVSVVQCKDYDLDGDDALWDYQAAQYKVESVEGTFLHKRLDMRLLAVLSL